MNVSRFPLIVLLSLAGCSGTPAPPPPASLEKFKAYYAEEMFLVERARLTGEDSLGLRVQLDSLRGGFGLTRGECDTLLAYYRDSLPRWELFLSDVARRLDEREGALERKRGAPETAPDSR